MKTYLVLLTGLAIFIGCRDNQKSKMKPLDGNVVIEKTQSSKPHPGKRIMEQECYICHDPKATMANRIAPPMEAIKRHYIDSNTTKEEFTEALIRWVNDPEAESKMPGAHKRFGPMPYMPNPDDAVAQIALYLYDNEIERPKGFDTHFKNAHKKGVGMGACECFADQEPENEYAVIGLAHALEAKAELGRNLKNAIQAKGTVGAIRFCHTEATRLTDSVSMMKNAIIKRVSDRARNPENQANEEELGYIANFKKIHTSDEDIQPIVNIDNGKINFYYPITTNGLCLQCHGKPNEQILPETLGTLKNLYPGDKAINYDINEVRGIWSIEFDADR